MSRDFTVYQATDPATPAQQLEDMATRRPDLRPFVAANPSTAPQTLEWLGTLGDLGVDAALARRGQAPYGPPAATDPFAPPSGADPYVPPLGAGPYAPPDPYAPPSGAGPYPPVGAGPYAPPGAYAPIGTPPTPGAPFIPAPAGAGFGYQPPQPARNRTALVVAIAMGAVVVFAALVFAASSVLGSLSGSVYGDDPQLDRLWDQCAAGNGKSCDDLYLQSPIGSDYEEFGDTCGDRFPPQQIWCEDSI